MKKILSFLAELTILCSISCCCDEKPKLPLLPESDFEAVLDGKAISLTTIRGGGLTLQATNFGGRVVSLFVPDRTGTYRDVVLGHDTIDEYIHYKRQRFLGSCVGPVANRICNATFTIDGTSYELEKNHGGKGTLHGGFTGLDSVVWDIESTTENSVTYHYIHKDGEGGFPGNLDIHMTYSLTDDAAFQIKYSATTDKTRPVNISNHPYFNFSESGTVEDYILYINADAITGIDGLDILEPQPVKGTAFDYRRPHTLREALESDEEQIIRGKGFDHNFCICRTGYGLCLDATVFDPESGIYMEVISDQPGLQVYSGQYMDGKEDGKRGSTLNYHGSITLETQNWPDAPNKPSFPNPYLKPGETYKHTCIYKFSSR